MGAQWPANNDSSARGQSPPAVQLDDGTDNIENPAERSPLIPSSFPADGFDPFPAPGIPRPSAVAHAYTVRPFDVWAQYDLTGQHGVITRQDGSPVGSLLPFDGPNRAVFRPVPNAWDAGYWTQPDQQPWPRESTGRG